jgi:1,4-alpha-glucan branching enzyme
MAKATITLKKQTFRLIDPEAERVLLAGDFTQWQKGAIPMRNEGNGLWTQTVDLGPGTYSYLFIVDGEWRDDPECTIRVANPFGGQNMVRQVAG